MTAKDIIIAHLGYWRGEIVISTSVIEPKRMIDLVCLVFFRPLNALLLVNRSQQRNILGALRLVENADGPESLLCKHKERKQLFLFSTKRYATVVNVPESQRMLASHWDSACHCHCHSLIFALEVTRAFSMLA